MTWSYSEDPSSSSKDAVRFLIQDTVVTRPLISDEEIAYLLSQNSNPSMAAAAACRVIAAKYSAGWTSKTVGDLTISFSERFKYYMDMADRLEQDGIISTATPYLGGMSKSDKRTRDNDEDRVPNEYAKGQMDNPRSGYESDRRRDRYGDW